MNFFKNQMNAKVNIGAKIYAALLIAFNGMAFISYYNVLRNPDLLRTVAGEMSLPMTDDQIQMIIAELPLQLVMMGIVIFGLLMLMFNQRWGFVPFAAILIANTLMAFINRDLTGGFSALLPVALMALILWGVPKRRKQGVIKTNDQKNDVDLTNYQK